MPLRIVISADEFGCRVLSTLDNSPKMNEEGISVPFSRLEEFVANLRRIANELESKQFKGEW